MSSLPKNVLTLKGEWIFWYYNCSKYKHVCVHAHTRILWVALKKYKASITSTLEFSKKYWNICIFLSIGNWRQNEWFKTNKKCHETTSVQKSDPEVSVRWVLTMKRVLFSLKQTSDLSRLFMPSKCKINYKPGRHAWPQTHTHSRLCTGAAVLWWGLLCTLLHHWPQFS